MVMRLRLINMADIEIIKKYKFFDLEFKKLDDAASFFCVSKQMMSSVFSGKKKPSKKMLDKAGIAMGYTFGANDE